MDKKKTPTMYTTWSSNKLEDQFVVENPATSERIVIVQGSGASEVDKAVQTAQKAYESWRWVSPHERGKLLRKAAVVVKDHFEEIAQLETLEEGKPIFISRGDTQRCIEAFEYFGGLIGNLPTDLFDLGAVYASVILEPYGVVAGIIPFNWPPLHTAAKAAPALAVGNSIILKPGDNAPLTIMRIVELLQEVFPPGLLQVIAGPGVEAGRALSTHPLVKKIAFTGSSQAGKAILRQAANNLTPCMMELGGKNAFVILPDYEIDKLLPVAYEGAFYNNGQACTAISRFIVHRSQYDEFVQKFSDVVRNIRVGDGADEETQVGPLVSKQQQQRVLSYLDIGLNEGAVIAAQAKLPEASRLKNGFFVPPTLFSNVKPNMRIAQEEMFGPVTCAIPYDDIEEAVAIADGTEYGLVAVVYSNDYEKALRIARQLDVGTAYVNNFYRLGLDCVPFGGNKASGFGRERSIETLHEFGRSKTIKSLSGIGDVPVMLKIN
jgi:acyl-CoA reductase-like NAD-dependent aldehyde dehydrogenase